MYRFILEADHPPHNNTIYDRISQHFKGLSFVQVLFGQLILWCNIDSEVLHCAASVTFSCCRPVETFLAWHCILAIKMPSEMSS